MGGLEVAALRGSQRPAGSRRMGGLEAMLIGLLS